MLTHFLRVRRIHSFKEEHSEWSDDEVNDMRTALLLSGDLEYIYGKTQSTRYKTTKSGKSKVA